VVSLRSRPFYIQGNSAQYPSNRRLDGPQIRSERFGEKTLGAFTNRTPDCSARGLVIVPSRLARLSISQVREKCI
jgi:hypothetical protein